MDPTAIVEGIEVTQQGEAVNIALTGAVAAAVVYGRQVAEIVHKLIPDSATGPLATVRQIAGILAGYAKNRD